MDGATPLRGVIIAIAALAVLAVAAALVAARHDSDLGGLAALLLLRFSGASLLCALLAWGAVLSGLLSVIAFYAAFSEAEDPHDRKRFPRGAPAFLFLVSLGLLWLSFLCATRPAAAPAETAPVVRPEPAAAAESEPAPEPLAPEPVAPGASDLVPLPEVSAIALPMRWDYADPLIVNGDYIASPALTADLAALFPLADDDGAVGALLCGKAWVAIAGAASQEGPHSRNDRRARVRAELAAAEATRWLEAQPPGCRRPIVLGLDLGQHVETLAAPTPAATAAQRQILIAARALASPEERISAGAALAELEAFAAGEAARGMLLAGRRYRRDPVAFFFADPR